MRKKVIGLGMILAMSAALYGCSGDTAGNKPTEHTTIEETTEEEAEKDHMEKTSDKDEDEKNSKKEEKESDDEQKDKSDDNDRSKSDRDEKIVKTVKTVKKVGKRDEAESDSKVTDEDNKETKKNSSTKKDASVESSVFSSSEVTKAEEKPAENIADNPDVQHQIKVITTASCMWYQPDDTSLKYMVTDFDHDGHFEITVGSLKEPGHHTHLDMWEVTETNDGLVEINTPPRFEVAKSYTLDLIQNGGYITYSNDSEYVYIASNYGYGDAAYGNADCSSETVNAFKLDGDTLKVEPLAMKETKGETVQYFKPNEDHLGTGDAIEEADFINCAYNTYGADHEKYETQLMWTDLQSGDMTTELLNSYVAFYG